MRAISVSTTVVATPCRVGLNSAASAVARTSTRSSVTAAGEIWTSTRVVFDRRTITSGRAARVAGLPVLDLDLCPLDRPARPVGDRSGDRSGGDLCGRLRGEWRQDER